MPTLQDNSHILTKHRCPDCYKGKIPKENQKQYHMNDFTYCATCDGTGWIEYWTSLYELNRALSRIETIEQMGK